MRREFTALSSVFEFAINGRIVLEETIERNPVRHVDRKHLADAAKKDRGLTPKELDWIIDERTGIPIPPGRHSSTCPLRQACGTRKRSD